MRKPHYKARELAAMSPDELWGLPDSPEVIVEFDAVHGEPETLVASMRATVFSAYMWRLCVDYPLTPLKPTHHLGTARLNPTTHLEMLNKILWDCYEAYNGDVDIEELCKILYQSFNQYYNDYSTRLEAYITTFSIETFLDVLDEPRIAAAIEGLDGRPGTIEHAYRVADEVIMDDHTVLTDNAISQAVRSKLVKMSQVKQTMIARGRLTDIDSHFFPEAIPASYFSGLNTMLASMEDSRTIGKADFFKDKPISDSEYFNRKLQLMAATVQSIDYACSSVNPDDQLNSTPGDCGSRHYVRWTGGAKDVSALNGKHFVYDEDLVAGRHILHTVRLEDREKLRGKVIHFRSPLLCYRPNDPQSVCATCYGDLAISIPRGTNIGHVAAIEYGERVTQNMLGIKHVDFSSGVARIQLPSYEAIWLQPSSDNRSLMLGSRLASYKLRLSIAPNEATQLTEINFVDDVTSLPTSRISEISEIYLTTISPKDESETVCLNVEVGGKFTHLSHALLAHIQRNGYELSDTGRFVVDLTGFNIEQPILEVPNRDENILDYLDSIIKFISSTDDSKERTDMRDDKGWQDGRRKMLRKCRSPEEALSMFHELTSRKMLVNMVHLEILVLATMGRSMEDNDYRLPYPGNKLQFGQLSKVIANRSEGAMMAFEKHSDVMRDPATYINHKRPNHPLDDLLVPKNAAF